MTATEFCETRVLPVVLAFGFGVLAMGAAIDHRESEAIDLAQRAVAVAKVYREACGPSLPPEALPVDDLDRIAEVRP